MFGVLAGILNMYQDVVKWCCVPTGRLSMYRDAERQFKSAINDQPMVDTYLYLAKVYVRLDQPLTAIEIYKQGLEKFPNELTLIVGQARIYEVFCADYLLVAPLIFQNCWFIASKICGQLLICTVVKIDAYHHCWCAKGLILSTAEVPNALETSIASFCAKFHKVSFFQKCSEYYS